MDGRHIKMGDKTLLQINLLEEDVGVIAGLNVMQVVELLLKCSF